MNFKSEKRIITLLGITTFITGLIYLAYSFGVFNTPQDKLTDGLFIKKDASKEILIVDIDEESLRSLGQWPWNRGTHAKMLSNLDGAKTVGFDVIFSESSNLGSSDDQLFSKSIEDFSGEVILPIVISEQTGLIKRPIEVLNSVSKQGFVNTKTQRDGIVRYYDLKKNGESSFDIAVSGADPCSPSTCNEQIRIPYNGPAKTYNTISYIDIYNGVIPKKLLEDKTVLIGASASGLGDIYQTPFGAMPGVEIHANVIEALKKDVRHEDISSFKALLLMLLVSVLTLLVSIKIKSIKNIFITVVLIPIFILPGSFLAFESFVVIPHLYLLYLFIFLFSSLLMANYIFEAKEKRFIKKGFEHYVAPEVVKEISSNPEKLTLGGDSKELSILFSDIRDFTSISEKLTPQELMSQLNEYLEEMAGAVIDKKGLVDKYIGDAVMAFWGAPIESNTKSKDACLSAILMMERLERLNKRWKKQSKPLFKIGIGISTGNVVVGNMGSKERFNYSIIGDEVNFAARVEGLTKSYGVNCIIGPNTYKKISDDRQFYTRELDEVVVKGKKESRMIYELLTEKPNEGKLNCLKEFELGKTFYKEGNFEKAKLKFKEALSFDKEDGPSSLFLDRCSVLENNPPENWDGIFRFKKK